MKNPLNSILNQNLNLQTIVSEIKKHLYDYTNKKVTVDDLGSDSSLGLNREPDQKLGEHLHQGIQGIYKEIKLHSKIQDSSSYLLNHQINCMMDYAAISSK